MKKNSKPWLGPMRSQYTELIRFDLPEPQPPRHADESYWAPVPPGRITADEARLKKKGSSDPLASPHAHPLEPASAWRHMEEELWPSSRFYHRK